jgi:hypothetical protein
MKSSFRLFFSALLILGLAATAVAQQSTATLTGTVMDPTGAVIPNAKITITNKNTQEVRRAQTDSNGYFTQAALPPGTYNVAAEAPNFQAVTAENLILDVNRTVNQNLTLGKLTGATEAVTVTAEAPVIENATMTQGQVIPQQTVQEIPLNGRHFVDLSLLTVGTVTPPANGFLTAPLRGQGSFGVNTAGNREDEVNFMVNGVNLNDMANGQITFQPSINTVSEFKLDNSTYSADEGRNAGAIINVGTRSGTNSYHGEAFDYVRNDWFDARNFFNKAGTPMSPFKRNNFGAAFGGPIIKNKTFFFLSYEAVRQRQGLTLNTLVLSNAQRAAVTNATSAKLLTLIPTANDPTGTRFLGSAVAPVNIDQGTADVQHNIGANDRVHGYFAFQRDVRKEPTLQGGSVPGAGDTRQSHRQILTFSESHIFSATTVNDARFGYNRIHITFTPDNNLDPSSLGINDGLTGPVGIPQIIIGQTGIVFGGIGGFPQGRGDYTGVLSDTLSQLRGKHALKLGGEVRRFNGNGFSGDNGTLSFSNVAGFQSGAASAFSVASGFRPARVYDNAWGLFGVDTYKISPQFTLELGLRWDWNMSPTEAENRTSFFNPATDTLIPFGSTGYTQTLKQNNKLFQPRVGFIWDAFANSKVIVRGGYGLAFDQPLPGAFIFNGNPPFSSPLAFTSSTAKPTTTYSTLLTDSRAGGFALATTDPNFRDAYVQSWNLNLESQITPTFGGMIGYFGNKGTHMELDLPVNPIVGGVRTFKTLAASSPIAPGAALGNITERSSLGTSNYNALWVTAQKRIGHGLQFTTSYTWSHSFDLNSRNFQGVVVQNPFDIRSNYGPSDFDVRNRFVFSAVYQLPFHGNRLFSGWEVSPIIQLQSGNPLNVVAGSPSGGTAISGFTGVSTIRPDILGPVRIAPTFTSAGVQWFANTAVCDPRTGGACPAGAVFAVPVTGTAAGTSSVNNYHFGNLGRNALTGPTFKDVDLNLSKNTKITERFTLQLRVDAFDLFNHPNFGNPNLTATPGSANFGIISSTRFPTGDAGSARQLQLSAKLLF